VAIQSSDDTYADGAFRSVAGIFREQPELGLVYGDVEYVDTRSHVVSRTNLPPFDLGAYIGKRTFIPQPAAFFTAAALRQVGEWRADISYAADAEFYLRIATQWSVRKVDRVLARYRYHDEQRDKSGLRVQRDWERAIAPWTHSSDRRLRRLARTGIQSVRIQYTPQEQWLLRTWHVYRALLINPALIADKDFRRTNPDLLPGRYPIVKTLSWIKRRLGFPARRG
jgi:hypothetical protein